MLGKNSKLRSLFFTVVLNIFGVVIAFILIEMLFRTNSHLVPRREVRVNPPVRRINPFRDEMHQVKLSPLSALLVKARSEGDFRENTAKADMSASVSEMSGVPGR
jgi:hypothetical protein